MLRNSLCLLFSFFATDIDGIYVTDQCVQENPEDHLKNRVVEIYTSGDYSCNNCGDDRCPCFDAGHFHAHYSKFNYLCIFGAD